MHTTVPYGLCPQYFTSGVTIQGSETPLRMVYNLAVETTTLADAAINYGVNGLPRKSGLYGQAVLSAVMPATSNGPKQTISEQVGAFVAINTRHFGRKTDVVLLNQLHVLHNPAVNGVPSVAQWLYNSHPAAKKEIGSYMLKTLLKWDEIGTLREDDAADSTTVETLYKLLSLQPFDKATNAQRRYMDYCPDVRKKVLVLPRKLAEQLIKPKYTNFAPEPVLTTKRVLTSHLATAGQKGLPMSLNIAKDR